jgi:hypothetical protein
MNKERYKEVKRELKSWFYLKLMKI